MISTAIATIAAISIVLAGAFVAFKSRAIRDWQERAHRDHSPRIIQEMAGWFLNSKDYVLSNRIAGVIVALAGAVLLAMIAAGRFHPIDSPPP